MCCTYCRTICVSYLCTAIHHVNHVCSCEIWWILLPVHDIMPFCCRSLQQARGLPYSIPEWGCRPKSSATPPHTFVHTVHQRLPKPLIPVLYRNAARLPLPWASPARGRDPLVPGWQLRWTCGTILASSQAPSFSVRLPLSCIPGRIFVSSRGNLSRGYRTRGVQRRKIGRRDTVSSMPSNVV